MPVSQRLTVPGALLYAPINIAASGDILTPTTGKRINIVSLFAVPAAAVVTTFRFGTTALTGAMTLAAGLPIPGMFVEGLGATVFPLWQGAVDEKFNAVLGTSVQLSGGVWYFEDTP